MAKGFKQASDNLNAKETAAHSFSADSTKKEAAMPTFGTDSALGKKTTSGHLKSFVKAGEVGEIKHEVKPPYSDSEPATSTYHEPHSSFEPATSKYHEPHSGMDYSTAPKKKKPLALIIGIAAAVVVCVSVAGGMQTLKNGDKGMTTSVADSSLSGANGMGEATGSLSSGSSDTSSSSASSSGTYDTGNSDSNNYVKSKDRSGDVFNTFSDYAHTYEKQQIPLIGMSSEESNNYDKTTVSLPAEMEGEDKNFVGSINPAGVTFEWESGHGGIYAPFGESYITIKYGVLNNEPGNIFKSYLSEYSKVYHETTNSYAVTYDSSKYKSSSKKSKEKQPTFKEMCQNAFDNIQASLNNVEGSSFTNNEIYVQSNNCTIKEKYYYSSSVCAREMIIYKPLHTSIEIKMMKAVNCGDTVRIIYGNYFSDDLHSLTELREFEQQDLYEIEQAMIDF